jgi:hypothetical protein
MLYSATRGRSLKHVDHYSVHWLSHVIGNWLRGGAVWLHDVSKPVEKDNGSD